MKFSCLFAPVKSVKFPTRITGQLRDYADTAATGARQHHPPAISTGGEFTSLPVYY